MLPLVRSLLVRGMWLLRCWMSSVSYFSSGCCCHSVSELSHPVDRVGCFIRSTLQQAVSHAFMATAVIARGVCMGQAIALAVTANSTQIVRRLASKSESIAECDTSVMNLSMQSMPSSSVSCRLSGVTFSHWGGRLWY